MKRSLILITSVMGMVSFLVIGCGMEQDGAGTDSDDSYGKGDGQQSSLKNSLSDLRQSFEYAAKYRYKDPPKNMEIESDPYREVDAYEAKDIIEKVKLDGITPSEIVQFRYSSECEEYSCRYETLDSADELFRRFLNSDEQRALLIPGVQLDDPPLATRDNDQVSYQAMAPRLMVEGKSPYDVQPGKSFDDSFFLASLSALARGGDWARTAWDFNKALQWNDDGTFTVTFHEAEKGAVKINVDSDIPVRNGKDIAYAHSRNAGELWPAIYEKAYAQWKGGYDALASGGSAADVLSALVGRPVESVQVTNSVELFEKLKQAGLGHNPMVATAKNKLSYMVDMAAKRRDGLYIVLHASPVSSGDPIDRPEYHDGFNMIRLPFETFVELFSEVDIVN